MVLGTFETFPSINNEGRDATFINKAERISSDLAYNRILKY